MDESNKWHGLQKSFEGTGIPYDDGMHVLYVNAAVDDGSEIAKLMAYFKTTEPDDMSQGALSERVHFLKKEKGGYEEMCQISEKWYKEGETAGLKEGLKEGLKAGEEKGEKKGKLNTLFELVKDNLLPKDEAAKRADMSVSDFTKAYNSFFL